MKMMRLKFSHRQEILNLARESFRQRERVRERGRFEISLLRACSRSISFLGKSKRYRKPLLWERSEYAFPF